MTTTLRPAFLALAVLAAGSPRPASAAGCAHCAEHGAKAAGHEAEGAQPAPPAPRYHKSTHDYAAPAVTLLDQDGKRVPLAEALAPGGPVALNFIFTTCTSICPVMSATFASLRRQLGADGEDLRMVSISIDPEHDRPAQLAAYARRFEADGRWRFYTGTAADVRTVLAAFDVLPSDKTAHQPVTMFRAAGARDWIRIDGLASAAALAGELRQLRASR